MEFFRKKSKEINEFDNYPAIGAVMASKMIFEENRKPQFLYREKRTRPEDSGWRIFTGFESEEYNDNPDNIGIYNPSTILKIDPSLSPILLKGIGSVYEKTDANSEWYKVTDFDLEDDFITTHRLTDEWTININNLFERSIEEDGTLYYTTGDKSIRLTIWNSDKNKQELVEEYRDVVENRDQSRSKTLEKFEFSDDEVSRIGYRIEEAEDNKTYHLIFGFSIVENQILQTAFYFDEKSDFDWAITTWKNLKFQ